MLPEKIINVEGDFQYTQDSFALTRIAPETFYKWNEIEEITANKLDLMTTDEVRLNISFSSMVLTISEEMPGWPLFIEKLMNTLPGIAGDWEEKVIETPFAANTTIIYKR